MRNEHAVIGIYAPFAAPAGLIIPDEVQDFIRERMRKSVPVSSRPTAHKTNSLARNYTPIAALAVRKSAHRERLAALTPRILELRRSGMAIAAVAKEVGIGPSSAREVCFEHGVMVPGGGQPRFAGEVHRMIEMRAAGMKMAEIARQIGCSECTVAYRLRMARYGAPATRNNATGGEA